MAHKPSRPAHSPQQSSLYRGVAARQARSTTRPELPAVSVKPSSAIPSWVDELDPDESDRITEVTDLSDRLRLDPEALRNQPALVRLDGAHAGELYEFKDESFTVGRHPSNQLSIDDPGISRFHARFSRQGDSFVVQDLGSRNGTFMGGQPLQQSELQDGDVVQLGPRATLRFALLDRDQRQLMQRLYESSTVDALTGAHNRKHFDERLESEVAFSRRHTASLALILFDIDHFKNVNDSFGHSAGDEVLRQVASACQKRLRTEDVFARFGGEEFAVVLRGVTLDGAAHLAERLRSTVAAVPMLHAGRPIPITISAGCATLDCCESFGSISASQLIDIADERLYKAKRGGRNRVEKS